MMAMTVMAEECGRRGKRQRRVSGGKAKVKKWRKRKGWDWDLSETEGFPKGRQVSGRSVQITCPIATAYTNRIALRVDLSISIREYDHIWKMK